MMHDYVSRDEFEKAVESLKIVGDEQTVEVQQSAYGQLLRAIQVVGDSGGESSTGFDYKGPFGMYFEPDTLDPSKTNLRFYNGWFVTATGSLEIVFSAYDRSVYTQDTAFIVDVYSSQSGILGSSALAFEIRTESWPIRGTGGVDIYPTKEFSTSKNAWLYPVIAGILRVDNGSYKIEQWQFGAHFASGVLS